MSATSDLAHGYPPDRLVPGDPGAVSGLGDALAGYADLLADAARALGRVEVEWDGAAAGRFRDEFGLQPGRFSAAAAAFDTACAALGRYAATLLSAQLAAVRARDLFAEGLRSAAALVGGPLGVDAAPLDLLTSPAGREQRLAAVELLERVRADVDRAGHEAAETLRGAMAAAPEPVPAWQHAWNFLLAPPWDLNQERRDWAAGAVIGVLDTLVLATNPLPVALWVGATSKPQVNAVEWRLGIDPRSGLHTAGSVIVPSILTGAVGLAPARVGITLNELESEAPETVNVFRGMVRDADGLPRLGSTARDLGVRLPDDIDVTVDGSVLPGTGGMSVNDDIQSIPPFRRPPAFDGTDKRVSMFSIDAKAFGDDLQIVPDHDGHNTVQPQQQMTLEAYLALLQETRTLWKVVSPS